MKRILFSALLVTIALMVFAGDLWAHGGQYRGPGGAVPPNQREPSDPTPPAPPPPSGPPVTPPPTTPSGPAPSQPTTPPPVPGTPSTPGPTIKDKTKGAKGSLGFENWVFWYHNNKADIENLKQALYSRVASENPLFQIGGRNLSNTSDATHDTRALVESVIIPALKRVMAAKKMHQDTQSAAYIALAKVAREPLDIELIMKGLAPKLKHDLIVQESAAIGLGLLRRDSKENQFEAGELDKVRDFLFGVFENDDYQARTRGFAALAIGLLGDQPSGSGSYAGHSATTERLFGLLQNHDDYKHPDLVIGILMAIGLQQAPSVTGEQKDALRRCLMKGTLYKRGVQSMTRSYVALTLGRIGDAKDIEILKRAMTSKRNKDRNIQRSCAIGLGQLGRLVQGEDRVAVAKTLLTNMNNLKDASAKNYAVISLSDLIIADIKQNKTDVIGSTKAGEHLLKLAESGRYIQRPFGALALGLIGKEIGDQTTVERYGEFRSKSLEILRNGLKTKKLDKRGRAAFATSLGIVKDLTSVKDLVAIVSDKKEDQELRGYAALALGLIGNGSRDVKIPIREALKERRSEELRQQTATALGLLKDPEAVPLLLAELKRAKSQNVKGQVVLALAKIGDARAVEPMIKLLESKREQDLTRALACAGLGVIGDLEWLPSLSRISLDVNYRASTDLINEVLSLI